MKRRDAMELLVIGSAAPIDAQVQHQHAPAPAAKTPVAPVFFSTPQFALVDTLAEMILPADSHSGGAHEAQVAAFIDDVLNSSPAETKAAWRAGLDAVDAEAKKRHAKLFVDCSAEQRDAILREMAAGESSPQTELQRFFVRIKAQTLSGYYTSSVGLLKDLQYKGIVPIAAYPACEHPDHHKGGK